MGSLGNGAAPFRTWRASEIPEVWRRVPAAERRRAAAALGAPEAPVWDYVAVELPDYPWAWAYLEWHRSTDHGNPEDPPVSPMVVARENFRENSSVEERANCTRRTLWDLLHEGRPTALWARCWSVDPQGAPPGR